MPEDDPVVHAAWDWGQQRLTLGRHFIRDMEGLWSEVLKLAAVVEDSLNQSIHALCDGRIELADEIRHQKPAVDRWEVQIERECVRVLALHQPVASDLRRVAAVLKINGDLRTLGRPGPPYCQENQEALDRSSGIPDPPAPGEPGHRGPEPGSR